MVAGDLVFRNLSNGFKEAPCNGIKNLENDFRKLLGGIWKSQQMGHKKLAFESSMLRLEIGFGKSCNGQSCNY
jgi:hypothetical protein